MGTGTPHRERKQPPVQLGPLPIMATGSPRLPRTPHYQGKDAVGQPGPLAHGFVEGPTSNTSSSRRRAPKIVTPSVLTRG